MLDSIRPDLRRVRAQALGCAVAVLALFVAVQAVAGQFVASPISEGQKFVMATHSFMAFIGPNRRPGEAGPLAALAREAEIQGHENLEVQMIGASTPMQHWNQGDGDDSKNLAKAALRAGGVDVFTMSPNAIVPEEGIDLFGDLMIETNPMGRFLVQHSWSAWDGHGRTPSVGGKGAPGFSNEDRDDVDVETIQAWIDAAHAEGGYLDRLRAQLTRINERAGRNMAYVVPVADAVYRLRQEVLRGDVPGVERQSALFLDPIGHAAEPVRNLVTYVWFTVMYRQPANGLTALVDPDDPTSADRERLLQRIAWEAAVDEPMSGLMLQWLWRGRAHLHEHGRHQEDGHH